VSAAAQSLAISSRKKRGAHHWPVQTCRAGVGIGASESASFIETKQLLSIKVFY
jgi:hypothetical protein